MFPYTGYWDIKPPGIYLAHTLSGALSHVWPGAAGLMDLAALAAAILVTLRLMRLWGLAAAGPAAAVALTGLWTLAGDWWDVGQAERLAVPLFLLALLGASRPQRRRWAAAGACLAMMVLLKTSFLPWALCLLPFLLHHGNGTSRRRLGTAAAAGFAVPVAAVFIALLAAGAVGEAYGATIGFTGPYTRMAWQRPMLVLRTLQVTGLAFLAATWPLWLLALAGCWRPGSLSRLARRGLAAVLMTLVIATAMVIAQGKFFPYHWVALWPPLALAAGMGTARLVEWAGGRWPALASPSRQVMAAALLATLAIAGGALTLAPGWPSWQAAIQYAAGARSREAYLAGFRVQGMAYDELQRTATAVAAATPADEPLLLWGFEPAFYLYARRDFPGRFPFAYPLITPWAPDAWRQEFLSAFEAAPAAAVVVRRGDPIPWVAGVGGDAAARLERFPAFRQRLQTDYVPRPDLSSPHLQVWLRRR